MNHLLISDRLQQYKNNFQYRELTAFTEADDLYLTDHNERYVSFCGNDYLGLSNHPNVIQAFKEGVDRFGVGSGGSSLICGYRQIHQAFEQNFAKWVNFPRALLFANGYMANQAVLTALTNSNDRIYQDHDNHASLLDAGKISTALSRRYLHMNCKSLERFLKKPHRGGQRVIVSDAVFSMSGDIAPLLELTDLAKRYEAKLIIDDAHGMGVLGKTGRGILEHFSLSSAPEMIVVYPLGKAFGIYGAMVVGSDAIIESLIQFARSYIYTTAIPAAIAAAGLASLKVVQDEIWHCQNLQKIIHYFQQAASARALPINFSNTAIQTILINENQRVMNIAKALKAKGFLVGALRPPTVKKALLRISLRTTHSEKQMDDLLNQIKWLLES